MTGVRVPQWRLQFGFDGADYYVYRAWAHVGPWLIMWGTE